MASNLVPGKPFFCMIGEPNDLPFEGFRFTCSTTVPGYRSGFCDSFGVGDVGI